MLILAESEIPCTELQEALNRGQRSKFQIPFSPPSRLSFFIKYPRRCFKLVADKSDIAIRRLIPPIGLDLLLVAVHLPSKLYYRDNDQFSNSWRIAAAIREAENKVGHSSTIVVGDFNMNPFEPGVVDARGFHAAMDRRIARQRARPVQGELYEFLYNPIWGRMGDSSSGRFKYLSPFWGTGVQR